MPETYSFPAFRPADSAVFASHAPQFRDFLDWEDGVLWQLLNSEGAYQRMAAFSLSGMPALASLTHQLSIILESVDELGEADPAAATLADRARRAIGSMIRVVMEANGFRKTSTLRSVPPDPRRLFVRAAVYELTPLGEGVEPIPFDWDKYARRSSFANVLSLCPSLSYRPVPSMYDPDRRWFYLSSLDVDVPVDEEERLRYLFAEVRRGFAGVLRDSPHYYARLHAYKTDFVEICRMLTSIVSDPEQFEDPEALLYA